MSPGKGRASAGKGGLPGFSVRMEKVPAACPGVAEERIQGGDSFMQSLFWARFKANTGWKSFIFRIEVGPEAFSSTLLVLVRPLGLGFSFAYVPHGPGKVPMSLPVDAFLEALSEKISENIDGRLLFVRFDLAWEKEEGKSRALLDSIRGGRTRLGRGSPVQVPDTTILDLRKTEEEILGGMKPKWRYNIRLSEKKNVEVGREGAGALDVFYGLYEETARRDGIAIHPFSYYKTLLETADRAGGDVGKGQTGADETAGNERPSISVWVARHEGVPVASIITLFLDRHATYLYGASSNEKRNLMPAYALQWKAIAAAKSEGCRDYDFFGIPPDGNPNHAMAGLYLFKTGFGGSLRHRVGSIDYPLSRTAYAAFRSAEALRLFWHKKVKKTMKTAVHAFLKASGRSKSD